MGLDGMTNNCIELQHHQGRSIVYFLKGVADDSYRRNLQHKAAVLAACTLVLIWQWLADQGFRKAWYAHLWRAGVACITGWQTGATRAGNIAGMLAGLAPSTAGLGQLGCAPGLCAAACPDPMRCCSRVWYGVLSSCAVSGPVTASLGQLSSWSTTS